MYKGNLALQTGRELLTVSLDIEKNLHEVRCFATFKVLFSW